MPLYEYKCSKCGHTFEEIIRKPADEEGLACPKCKDTAVNRQMSAFATSDSGKSVGIPSGTSCGIGGG